MGMEELKGERGVGRQCRTVLIDQPLSTNPTSAYPYPYPLCTNTYSTDSSVTMIMVITGPASEPRSSITTTAQHSILFLTSLANLMEFRNKLNNIWPNILYILIKLCKIYRNETFLIRFI